MAPKGCQLIIWKCWVIFGYVWWGGRFLRNSERSSFLIGGRSGGGPSSKIFGNGIAGYLPKSSRGGDDKGVRRWMKLKKEELLVIVRLEKGS
jgi:hypothetical protein